MDAPDRIGDLIDRAGLGDRRAFAGLYAATASALFGLCLHVLGDRAGAEEAAAEAYATIWKNAGRWRGDGLSPMAWPLTIARNAAVARLRLRRAGLPRDERAELADLSPDPADAPVRGGGGRIAACLARLDPDAAEALRRAWLGGETGEDLARRFGVPPGTMRLWIRRSLGRLGECLWSLPPPGEEALLAAEHALDLLAGDEARDFERRLAADPALRAERARWAGEFAALAAAAPEEVPPPGLFRAVEARLFPEERQGLWRRLGVGPALAAAAVAALVLLLAERMGWIAPPGEAPPQGTASAEAP